MLRLPNGKPVDEMMIEAAMEDGSLENRYYLNTQTGEVILVSEYDPGSVQQEQLEVAIENYVPIERIPSQQAYQWMQEFVETQILPEDALLAEKLSIALRGKGAFRRFKDVLHESSEEWVQSWYHWQDEQRSRAIEEWFMGLFPASSTSQESET